MNEEEPSGARRQVKKQAAVIIVGVVSGLTVLFLGQHFWGIDSAIQNAQAVDGAALAQDDNLPAAEATFVGYGERSAVNPWPGWVSSEIVDIPPGVQEFPLPPGATNIGRPTLAVRTPNDPEHLPYVSREFVFNLKGLTKLPTMITDIEVMIASQGPAPSGTVVWYMPQGDTLRRDIGFDLTPGASRSARVIDEHGGLGENYFNERIVTLSRDEYLGYKALVFAPPDSDTEFFIRINFDNGTHVDLTDSQGENFRLTSYPRSTDRAFVNSTPSGSYDDMGLYQCEYPAGCAWSLNSMLQSGPR